MTLLGGTSSASLSCISNYYKCDLSNVLSCAQFDHDDTFIILLLIALNLGSHTPPSLLVHKGTLTFVHTQ